VAVTTDGRGSQLRTPTVAIVGAGVSGLCMGVRLLEAGITSFTIYEKAQAVGGTWRDNTYPGLSCDVPSRIYEYSFAPHDWSRYMSPGGEIWEYLEGVADRFALRPHLRFGQEIDEARFEDGRWHLRTKGGEESEADFLVTACGFLHHPRTPDLPGLDDFRGASFHSSRWDHDVALDGRRIGIVGNGSTGVQIVGALAPSAGRLSLFMRTPQWVFPAPNKRYSGVWRRLLRRFPKLHRVSYAGYQWGFEGLLGKAVVQPGWQRRLISALCRVNLRAAVRDPELRRRLTPDHEPMCKRIVLSAKFYSAMQRPSVELVDQGIDHVEARGVVDRTGRLHELDVLVLATGFDAHAYLRPIELVGPDGTRLSEVWEDQPRAYRTVALPGFPNFFMLMGPHSPIGNFSITGAAETQVAYIMGWIGRWRRGEVDAAAPTPEATASFNAQMRAAMPDTVYATGCSSWYLGADGLPELWPWTPRHFRDMLGEGPREEEWVVTTAG
jgi:cation diffusion facilitator CzcD-associated flavoprotein CzcO